MKFCYFSLWQLTLDLLLLKAHTAPLAYNHENEGGKMTVVHKIIWLYRKTERIKKDDVTKSYILTQIF